MSMRNLFLTILGTNGSATSVHLALYTQTWKDKVERRDLRGLGEGGLASLVRCQDH